MNFQEYLDQTIIFCDLDDTLVHSYAEDAIDEELMKHDGRKFLYDRKVYYAFLRPHARNFLRDLKAISKVIILTAGQTDFQKKVIEALNLPVQELYGRDTYDKVPKVKNPFLIDDKPATTHLTYEKLHAINSKEENLIMVPPWNRRNFNDNFLANFAQSVKKFINLQEFSVAGQGGTEYGIAPTTPLGIYNRSTRSYKNKRNRFVAPWERLTDIAGSKDGIAGTRLDPG